MFEYKLTNMETKKSIYFLLLFVVATCLMSFIIKFKYHLVDADISPKDLCGNPSGTFKKRCESGNFGIPFTFVDPFSPNVKEGTTKLDVAYSLVGRSYDDGDLSGEPPQVCAEEGDPDPFIISDIEQLGSQTGRDLTYKKSKKIELNVDAAIKANLDDIKKAVPSIGTTQIEKISIELKAAYEKVKQTELVITANYSEWELSQNVISDIKRGLSKYNKCKKYLVDHNQRLIVSIGLVYYNMTYNENSLDKLASTLDATLEAYSVPVSIGVSFKKQVSKEISASFKNGFQVVTWKTIGSEKFGNK